MTSLPTSGHSRTVKQAERLIRGRRRARIACIAVAIVGLEVAALCALHAEKKANDRWLGPTSVGYSHCASELEPLRDAVVRFAYFRHDFPRRTHELRGSDDSGTPWLDPRASIDDAFGQSIDLRVEETRIGERCSAWSRGPDEVRGNGDDVCLWNVEVSFGEVMLAVPSTR